MFFLVVFQFLNKIGSRYSATWQGLFTAVFKTEFPFLYMTAGDGNREQGTGRKRKENGDIEGKRTKLDITFKGTVARDFCLLNLCTIG